MMVERGRHERHDARTRADAVGQNTRRRQFGRGQMVASDHGLSSPIVFGNSDGGGLPACSAVCWAAAAAVPSRTSAPTCRPRNPARYSPSSTTARRAAHLSGRKCLQARLRGLRQTGRLSRTNGLLAAQLRGSDGARPGPGRRWPAASGRRRCAGADFRTWPTRQVNTPNTDVLKHR